MALGEVAIFTHKCWCARTNFDLTHKTVLRSMNRHFCQKTLVCAQHGHLVSKYQIIPEGEVLMCGGNAPKGISKVARWFVVKTCTEGSEDCKTLFHEQELDPSLIYVGWGSTSYGRPKVGVTKVLRCMIQWIIEGREYALYLGDLGIDLFSMCKEVSRAS